WRSAFKPTRLPESRGPGLVRAPRLREARISRGRRARRAQRAFRQDRPTGAERLSALHQAALLHLDLRSGRREAENAERGGDEDVSGQGRAAHARLPDPALQLHGKAAWRRGNRSASGLQLRGRRPLHGIQPVGPARRHRRRERLLLHAAGQPQGAASVAPLGVRAGHAHALQRNAQTLHDPDSGQGRHGAPLRSSAFPLLPGQRLDPLAPRGTARRDTAGGRAGHHALRQGERPRQPAGLPDRRGLPDGREPLAAAARASRGRLETLRAAPVRERARRAGRSVALAPGPHRNPENTVNKILKDPVLQQRFETLGYAQIPLLGNDEIRALKDYYLSRTGGGQVKNSPYGMWVSIHD